MKKLKSIFTFCLSLLPILGLLLVQPAAQPVAASAGQSAIAYVLPNDITGDEIHLINPDGTHDREIWYTGTSGLTTGPDVAQLTWKPDSSSIFLPTASTLATQNLGAFAVQVVFEVLVAIVIAMFAGRTQLSRMEPKQVQEMAI